MIFLIEKDIYLENNKFHVKKKIDDECITFGTFDTLDDAIKLRDELEEYGWPYKRKKPELEKIEQYIFKEKGKYFISKKIKNYEIIFGKFSSLDNAISFKHKLLENAWNLNFNSPKPKYAKYIRKDRNTYYIYRTIDGKIIHYGSFKYLDEAIISRDKLIDNNWNMGDDSILTNLGIFELDGLYHNIAKVGRNYLVFDWVGSKCIFYTLLPNLDLSVKVRNKLLDSDDINNDYEFLENYVDTKYIVKLSNSFYRISKSINGKVCNFGHYDSLEEAINVRDELMKYNWDVSKVSINKPVSRKDYFYNKNIHKFNDRFAVVKRIDGELKGFGIFDTVEDAIKHRDYLEKNNWNIIEDFTDEEKFDEYIFLNNNDNKYYLKNEIDGDIKIFGVFDEPLSAISARLDCIKANWNLPYISESEYSSDNNFNSFSNEFNGLLDNELEFLDNALNFPVMVGKSYKNRGWAVKRSNLISFVPQLPYEKKCKILLNGMKVMGKINIHSRLFYFKNEILENYLKKLHDIDPKTQTRIDLNLEYGTYKYQITNDESLKFKTKFSKSFKNGLFAIPRGISVNIIPMLPYEYECNFSINNIDVKGKFNLEFRLSFSDKSIISTLEKLLDDGDDVEVVLFL